MSAEEQYLEESTQLCRSTLLELAQREGLNPRDVFLQSAAGAQSASDPFACGTPGEWRWAEWFAEIFEAVGRTPIHVRGVHYWLIGRDWPLPEDMRKEIYIDGPVYLNTEKCWNYLEKASVYARWLELVDVDAIEDNRNGETQIFTENLSDFYLEEPDLENVAKILADQMAPLYSAQKRQPFNLEIVAEKSSATVQEIASDYHANVTIAAGHPSITRARDMFKRIMATSKPTRIFFLSDFDYAGWNMPATFFRKLEFWVRRKQSQGKDVKLFRPLLTYDQIVAYQLPRSFDVSSGKRAAAQKKAFEDRFGEGRVELDALDGRHPEAFREILEDAIEPYFDRDSWEETERVNEANLSRLLSAVREQLAIELVGAVDVPLERPPGPSVGTVQPEKEPLLDLDKPYLELLKDYHTHMVGEE